MNLNVITKKEKLRKEFLSNPRGLDYKKIITLLLSEWYEIHLWKWSHVKVEFIRTWEYFTVPLHNWDCKWLYKDKLREFYLKNN